MLYNKPPITIPQQIKLLKQRGLKFNDEKQAAHFLSNISFYRLRAYTYPFQDNSNPQHNFTSPVNFEDIISLYVFDRKLRILLFDALEKIEISLRTKIIYTYAIENGSHWFENANLYRKQDRFFRDINKLYEEVDRSHETFIKHYKATYTQPASPPSWMSLEVASIGLLSKLFENLKLSNEKKEVAKSFGLLHPFVLESWIHSFSQLRNICAHHGRLWNRRFTNTPQMPNKTRYQFLKNSQVFSNKLYAILCCMTYILHIISPGNNFNKKLKELIESCNLIDEREMGFPKEWKKELLWRTTN